MSDAKERVLKVYPDAALWAGHPYRAKYRVMPMANDDGAYRAPLGFGQNIQEAWEDAASKLPTPTVIPGASCGHCGRMLTGGIQRCSNGGLCCVEGQPETAIPAPQAQIKPAQEAEEKNENNANVCVVRPVDRAVLGPEKANALYLPISDDRNPYCVCGLKKKGFHWPNDLTHYWYGTDGHKFTPKTPEPIQPHRFKPDTKFDCMRCSEPINSAIHVGDVEYEGEPIQPSNKTRSECEVELPKDVHSIGELLELLKAALARAEKAEFDLHRVTEYWETNTMKMVDTEAELTTLRQQLKDSEQSGFNRGVEAAAVWVAVQWWANAEVGDLIRALKVQVVPTLKEHSVPTSKEPK